MFWASRAHEGLASWNTGRREESRRVVGRVPSASDGRRVGVEAEMVQDGHDRIALVDFGDDVAASTAGTGEDVVQVGASFTLHLFQRMCPLGL